MISTLEMPSRKQRVENGEAVHLTPSETLYENVEVSIVVPALNEEITIGEFVDWCKEGLNQAEVKGQILSVAP